MSWNKKNQKLLDEPMNLLYRQQQMLGLLDSSEDETEDEDTKGCSQAGRRLHHQRSPLATQSKKLLSAQPEQEPGISARTLEECDYCRASLFLSKVKGLPEENSVLCLEHTLMLLDSERYKHIDAQQLRGLVHVSVNEMRRAHWPARFIIITITILVVETLCWCTHFVHYILEQLENDGRLDSASICFDPESI